MADYHVGCGLFGIYAGILSTKNRSEWKGKSDVTDEAMVAVRDYLIGKIPKDESTFGYDWEFPDGHKVRMTVTVSKEG